MPARMSAAATPITFADGVTYLFAPLTDRQIDQIDEWLQAHVIDVARASLSPEDTPEERDETLTIAMREARKLSLMTTDGIRLLATIPGMTFLCWLSLRREHPEVSQDELRTRLMDPANLERVNGAFLKVNQRPGIKKKVPTWRNRKPTRKKRK